MASNIKSSGTAPPNHRIFTGGWSIFTVRRPIKKDKNSSKKKEVVKDNKELSMDIITKVLEDSSEGEDVRKRLDVFVKTRSVLKSLLGGWDVKQ